MKLICITLLIVGLSLFVSAQKLNKNDPRLRFETVGSGDNSMVISNFPSIEDHNGELIFLETGKKSRAMRRVHLKAKA
jgi:hypothetical protein